MCENIIQVGEAYEYIEKKLPRLEGIEEKQVGIEIPCKVSRKYRIINPTYP